MKDLWKSLLFNWVNPCGIHGRPKRFLRILYQQNHYLLRPRETAWNESGAKQGANLSPHFPVSQKQMACCNFPLGCLVELNRKLYLNLHLAKAGNVPLSGVYGSEWEVFILFQAEVGGTLISSWGGVSRPSRELTFHPLPEGLKQWWSNLLARIVSVGAVKSRASPSHSKN